MALGNRLIRMVGLLQGERFRDGNIGIYFTFNIYFAFINKVYISIPFLMIFQIGYFYVAFFSFFQLLWGRIIYKRRIRLAASRKNSEDIITA